MVSQGTGSELFLGIRFIRDYCIMYVDEQGAVWSAKLSHDASKAVSASADFTV